MIFAKVPRSAADSIKDMQRLVNLIRGSDDLQVDGALGPATSRAVAGLSQDQSKLVKELIAARPSIGAAPTRSGPVTAEISAIRAAIVTEADRVGVNPELALTVVNAESKFSPNAVSSTGASGLFQLTGSAVADVSKNYGSGFSRSSNRTEIAWNIAVGVRYLAICARYAGVSPRTSSVEDWAKIYACYNIGVGSYRHLTAQRYKEPELIRAVSQQAAVLQRGGVASYLANAVSYISSNVQRA